VDTFSCLRAVDASALGAVNLNISLSAFLGTFIFVPVVDFQFIVERPVETLGKGNFNGVGSVFQSSGLDFDKVSWCGTGCYSGCDKRIRRAHLRQQCDDPGLAHLRCECIPNLQLGAVKRVRREVLQY
jgi:hypothetical protein